MTVSEFFLQRYTQLQDHFLPNLFEHLTEGQLRTRCHPSIGPAAWYMWHMARVEDVSLSRLVWQMPQLYDQAWHERMNTGVWHYGTSMSAPQVDQLAAAINLEALQAYQTAVSARTRAELAHLADDHLDEVLGEEEVLQVVATEGMASADAQWVAPHYIGKSRGWCLCHFGLTHQFRHFGQLALIRKIWKDAES